MISLFNLHRTKLSESRASSFFYYIYILISCWSCFYLNYESINLWKRTLSSTCKPTCKPERQGYRDKVGAPRLRIHVNAVFTNHKGPFAKFSHDNKGYNLSDRYKNINHISQVYVNQDRVALKNICQLVHELFLCLTFSTYIIYHYLQSFICTYLPNNLLQSSTALQKELN